MYTANGLVSGSNSISASNKGNCYNARKPDGTWVEKCGHSSSAGLCVATNTCDDGSLVQDGNGHWVAQYPTGQDRADYDARHYGHAHHATCTGTHESIRVSHHKDERTFVQNGVAKLEGHHCKMIGSGASTSCNCRCHKLFRHDYHAGVHSDFTCPVGKHAHLVQPSQEVICETTDPANGPVYNPYSCDNTNPDVNQPNGIVGKKQFAIAVEWSCKQDHSKYDFGYYPQHRTPAPTAYPTAAPTENPCKSGTHDCDATNGFCLMTGIDLFKCGCNTNYALQLDLKTCVYQSGV